MALIVEDGTGKPDADSYCSTAYADSYHAALGNTAWDNVDDKDAMLRRATAYMAQAYGSCWDGFRVGTTQALDWPRTQVRRRDVPGGFAPYGGGYTYYPFASVPAIVMKACAELALRASVADLLPDLERGVSSESIGPISVSYEAGSSQLVRYKAVDAMLDPVLSFGSSMVMVRRS